MKTVVKLGILLSILLFATSAFAVCSIDRCFSVTWQCTNNTPATYNDVWHLCVNGSAATGFHGSMCANSGYLFGDLSVDGFGYQILEGFSLDRGDQTWLAYGEVYGYNEDFFLEAFGQNLLGVGSIQTSPVRRCVVTGHAIATNQCNCVLGP
ncbi:MAG: hypothetical protein ACLPX5_10635 [Dissulfurispiraceae bacterium]